MLKAEFRFFHIDFVPFLNFHIGVGHNDRHVSVTIKKQGDLLPVLICFSQLKSFSKKGGTGSPALDQCELNLLDHPSGAAGAG